MIVKINSKSETSTNLKQMIKEGEVLANLHPQIVVKIPMIKDGVKALKYFKIVITKFPNSVYAKDAKLKINYIKNSLAQNELLIGMFYLKNNSPASSIKRFQAIIKNYQTTSVIPETLYRLCEAFLRLGLKEEAIKSSSLLSYNFPDNEWTNLSKNIIKDTSELDENEGFINSITDYIKKITN